MGGRSASSGLNEIEFSKGKNDPELTDAIEDYNLPKSVREKLSSIKQIQSYNDLKQYLQNQGIDLDTDVEALKGIRGNDKNLKSISEMAQKVEVGIEIYKTVYGDNALSALKRVKAL